MNDFFRLYQELTADQIRERLEELAVEDKALRVLLRSKVMIERRQTEKQIQKDAFPRSLRQMI